jgi:hypothetical protein
MPDPDPDDKHYELGVHICGNLTLDEAGDLTEDILDLFIYRHPGFGAVGFTKDITKEVRDA